jgi:hypothetical protein
MPRVLINNLKTMGDVAMAYNWEIEIVGEAGFSISLPDTDITNIRCTNVQLPEPATENIDLDVKNFRIPLVGRPLVKQEFTATFFDTIDNEVTKFLYNWNRGVSNPETGEQLPLENVRATVFVRRLDRLLNPIYQYEFKGTHLLIYKGLEGTSTGTIIAPQGTFRFLTFSEKEIS